MVTEKSLGCHIVLIKNVHEWNSIFAKRRCKDNDFVVFAYFVNKFTAIWTHLNKNIANPSFNINGQHNVRMVSRSERTVHKSFINIKNQSFASFYFLCLGS